MVDYQGNSKREQEARKPPEDKKVEKVVTGKVVQRQKPLGRKMKELFFGGEAKNAAHYIAADVLLPAFRNLLVDAVTKGVERIVYGENAYPQRRGYTDYRSRQVYDRTPMRRDYIETTGRAHLPDQPMRPRSRRGGFEFILATRSEAEDVLQRLDYIVDKYDVASVADLKDLLGLQADYTDNKWGWVVLKDVEIRQIREGFLLDLPPAEEI